MGFFQKLRRKATGTGAPPTSLAATGDIENGSSIVKNISISTSTIFEGCTIAATGIPGATTVLRILNSTTIELSANATATTVGVALTFSDLFKYGQIATDGSSLYYASQTNTANRAVAATGALAESIDGVKTFTTVVKSGTTTLNDTPPTVNNDLTRKDYVDQRSVTAKRQTVVSGRKGSVHADFIEVGTGLSAVATADSTDPLITSIAAGFNTTDGLPVDLMNRTITDTTFSALTANATNFLGLHRDNVGVLTPIKSPLAPQYGSFFSSDRENKINATFNGNNGDTEFVDEYGNHFRAYGSGWEISNINQYSSMNTARCNSIAAGNRWECTPANLDNRSLDQWTIEFFYRFDSFATPQALVYASSGGTTQNGLYLVFNTSGQPLLSLSGNESGYNVIAGANTPNMNAIATRAGFGDLAIAGAAHTAAQWYHVAWVYNGLAHQIYMNGYLVASIESFYNSEVYNSAKPAKFNKIVLGAEYTGASAQNQMLGNISNFAFHPYAKYQTKKYATSGDTPSVRDIFTPPSVPLSLITQSDRYYQESEAIYLDFESANDNDVLTKDLYGRQLTAFGNYSTVLTDGGYIESGAAKFGTKSLKFSGAASYFNGAYIKAPVWADKWTVEFWGMDNSATATNKVHVHLVVPGSLGIGAFMIRSAWLGGSIRHGFHIGSAGGSTDIINFDTSYSYALSTYNHVAVSYDGVTYRCFVNGSLVLSTVSQLKVVNGSHFCFGRAADNIEHLTGKIDDFAYVPYCKYTGSFTPPATALLSSMPEQYLFDTKKMQMYKGYPTSFVADNSLFIGEALTSATSVEQIITYALNGEYRERFSSDFLGNLGTYTSIRSHRIGTRYVTGKLYGIMLNSSFLQKGEITELMKGYGNPYFASVPALGILNGKLYVINLGVGAGAGPSFLISTSNGSFTYIGATDTHLFDIIVEYARTF